MKTTFKKSDANFGCYSESQVKAAKLKASFTIADVLNATVSIKDKTWFIRNNCQFTNDEYRQFAIGCALCVLPIYEDKYPGKTAPRKAIEAAQAYLAGTIGLEQLREAHKAAASAVAVAAYAAYAAYAAAAADAYAADADAYAADAADAYAKNPQPKYTDLLLNFFKEFTSTNHVTG